ncbi:hypothetical protein KGF57_002287 [Candida theae]|uniref:C2H2-type domain-containing protein n=1 Tax=Candida theae TaxID=1198502 RepID=A0AAD5FZ44_9ASCO|nr:uncharacterized protein KGF57_002287 [Candida theae]KAI5958853.1 hypothetical protein KGF57_002287 [Candida theae]
MDLNQEIDQLASEFYGDFSTKSNAGISQKSGFADDFVITPDSGNRGQASVSQTQKKDDYVQLHSQYSKPVNANGFEQDILGDATFTEFQLNDINFEFLLKSQQHPQQQQQQDQRLPQIQETLLSNNNPDSQQFNAHHESSFSRQMNQPLHYQLQHQKHDQFSTNRDSKNVTGGLSGTFAQQGDNMVVDDSPPFTIESDLYFDQGLDNNSIITSNNLQNHNDNRSSIISHSNNVGFQNNHLKSPMQSNELTGSPFDDTSRVSSVQNIQHMGHGNFDKANNINRRSVVDSESQQFMGRLRNGSIDSYYAANVINQHLHPQSQFSQFQAQQQHQFQSQHQGGAQNNSASFQEMSPITTTTSNTHSVNSLHSTQPSFFSAQQFFTRNSLDQQPSSLTRPSSDFIGRPSLDSQQSQQQQQRNARYSSFTNSISNMIPFMGDRNQSQRSPPGTSTQPVMSNGNIPNQPRHLIRSIFKSNSALNSSQNQIADSTADKMDNNDDVNMDEMPNQFLTTSADNTNLTLGSESETQVEPPKKQKGSKRSLFTRFKSSKQDDVDESPKVGDKEPLLQESESLDAVHPGSGQASSGTPSFMTGGPVNLENTTSESSQNAAEPDYAALFENVGKRKPIGSNYRKPKREKTKEDQTQSQQPNTTGNPAPTPSLFFGKSTQRARGASSTNSLADNSSATNISVNSSNASSSHVGQNMSLNESDEQAVTSEIQPQPQAQQPLTSTSSLATASKRLLGGAKIMSKGNKRSSSKISKKERETEKEMDAIVLDEEPIIATLDTPVATMISKGVEVEVDLASLDLPSNTKIFPTAIINSKNRTRGRKENKEADLNDETKIFLCNYCSRRFKRHEHLKRHFRSLHTFEKPYDCPKCNKKFSRSDNLQQHLKVHNGEGGGTGAKEVEAEANEITRDDME